MVNNSLAISYIQNNPWAITQDGLELILSIASRTNVIDEQALQKIQAKQAENTNGAQVRDGIGILPISGPIFQKANCFASISGATSTEMIAKDFNSLLTNDEIRAIVLDIDSPGGAVPGIAELGEMIYDARGSKPIYAYVSHMGASAAYWIASATDRIILSPTSSVGSIGVILQVEKGEDDQYITFTSNQSPQKNVKPGTKEGKAKLQAYVDNLATVFVGAVAKHRGVSDDTVLTKFKQGGLAFAQEAVDLGMADKVSTFEKFFGKLSHTLATNPDASVFFQLDEPEPTVLEEPGEPEMSEVQDTPTAQPTAQAQGLTQADVDKVMASQMATFKLSLFNQELDAKAEAGKLLPAQVEEFKKLAKANVDVNPAAAEDTLGSLRSMVGTVAASNLLSEQVNAGSGTPAASADKKASASECPDNQHADAFVLDQMTKKLMADEKITYREAALKVEKSKEYQDAVAALK